MIEPETAEAKRGWIAAQYRRIHDAARDVQDMKAANKALESITKLVQEEEPAARPPTKPSLDFGGMLDKVARIVEAAKGEGAQVPADAGTHNVSTLAHLKAHRAAEADE